ncbi:apolipoprotein N-acyltransferase [Sphingobium wenxiniae]|uniref:Apolipoprotein N-acyltransferase n=2 Tax=Sphingobium wenxiniae (strain DSM 21828 / CGMCC 1.7748 / JZ-1) TaxID=595605 RepID=A0A562K7X5_SPHWJ|nr:apolipoprotein N-acyltransferase [Sphingobium wenxiniae]TWH91343.1 apolipoprotein N-acyltransferase [Sphingobium wenxiniae]
MGHFSVETYAPPGSTLSGNQQKAFVSSIVGKVDATIARRPGLTCLGAIAATGFAPWGFWPATAASLVLFLRTVGEMASMRRVFAASWWFGFGIGIASLFWLAHAFSFQAAMPPWLGWVAVALLSAYTALYWALAIAVAHAAARGASQISFAVYASASFMIAEWLRGIMLTGFPWNPLGSIWLAAPDVSQGAAMIGGLGLSGLTILLCGLVAAATHGASVRPLIAAIGIVAALLAFPRKSMVADTPIPISVVQANISQSDKWRAGAADAQLTEYIALTKARPSGAPRLIFWPEAAITKPLDTDPGLRRRAAAALDSQDLLFTGAIGTIDDEGLANSVFVLDAGGTVLVRYDKAHLVPFGEYLPFASILERVGMSRLVPGDTDFIAGPGPQTFDVLNLRAGVSICYEIIFPTAVIDPANRPAFLFNPSNDAWFGFGGPQQHLAQARLRAIEEGLPIIRATPTGETAVIRSNGSIAARLPAHEAGRLDAFLPSPGDPTPYSRWGNAIPLGAGIFMIAIAGLWRARRRFPAKR